MLNPGVLLIGVLPGILIRRVGRHLIWDRFRDELVNTIAVAPVDVAELLVETLYDVRQRVQLGLRLATAAARRNRLDLRVRIRQLDLLGDRKSTRLNSSHANIS